MALATAQKEFLLTAIEHLLDFSNEETALLDELQALKQALLNEVDTSHPFYFLSRCYQYPNEMLHGIEKMQLNQPLSLQDIQLGMLELIHAAIVSAAEKASLSLTKEQWDVSAFKNMITASASTPFVCTQTRQGNYQFPWENIGEEDDLFCASLFLRDYFIGIKITITLPYQTLTITVDEFSKLPLYLTSEEEVYDFLVSTIPTAKQAAIAITADHLIKCLMEHGFRDPILLNKLYNASFCDLICNRFYFQQLLNEKILIRKIAFISHYLVPFLLNKTIKSLIQHQIMEIKDVKYFNQRSLHVAENYYLLLLNKQIKINEIRYIQRHAYKILMQPIIANLIKLQALPFHKAKKLPVHLIPLLTSDLYMDFLLQHRIKWSRLMPLSADDCAFLLQPSVALLIKNNVFKLEHTHFIPLALRQTLLQKPIYDLMVKQVMSIDDLLQLTPKSMHLLLHHPHVRTWLAEGVITCDAFADMDLSQFYMDVYTARLHALCKKQPYRLYGNTDTMALLLQELPAAAYHANVSWQALREAILSDLIDKLRVDINNQIITAYAANDRKFFRYLRMQIVHALKHNVTFTKALAEIIQVTECILREVSLEKASLAHEPKRFLFSLFNRHQPVNMNAVRITCESIMALSEFISPAIEEKVIGRAVLRI